MGRWVDLWVDSGIARATRLAGRPRFSGRAFLYLSTDLTIRLSSIYPSTHLSVYPSTHRTPHGSAMPIYSSICRRLDVAERGRVEDSLGAEAPVGQHPLRWSLVRAAGAIVSMGLVRVAGAMVSMGLVRAAGAMVSMGLVRAAVRAHVICGEASSRHRDQS